MRTQESDFRQQHYLTSESKCGCTFYQVPFGNTKVTIYHSRCENVVIALNPDIEGPSRALKADVAAWVKKELGLELKPEWWSSDEFDMPIPNLRLDHRQEVVDEGVNEYGDKLVHLTLCGGEAHIVSGEEELAAYSDGPLPEGFKEAATEWIRGDLSVSSKALANLKVGSVQAMEEAEKKTKRERIESIIAKLGAQEGQALRAMMEKDLDRAYSLAGKFQSLFVMLAGRDVQSMLAGLLGDFLGGKMKPGMSIFELSPQGIRQL